MSNTYTTYATTFQPHFDAMRTVIEHPEKADDVMASFYSFYSAMYDGLITMTVPYADMVEFGRKIVCCDQDAINSLVGTLIHVHHDYFTSDRELAALALALHVHGLITLPIRETIA